MVTSDPAENPENPGKGEKGEKGENVKNAENAENAVETAEEAGGQTSGAPQDENLAKRAKKKTLLWVIGLAALFLPLLFFLNTLDFSLPVLTGSSESDKTPETYSPQAFYTPEEIASPSVAAAYRQKERTVGYTFDGQTVALAENFLPDAPFSSFFYAYFRALAEGDSETLNGMYSDYYYKDHARRAPFAPQRPFDIDVRRIGDSRTITAPETEDDLPYLGWDLTFFEVRYKLFYNDGGFRRDIVDDDVRPLVIRLLTDRSGKSVIAAESFVIYTSSPAGANGGGSLLAAYLSALILLVAFLLFGLVFLLSGRRRPTLLAASLASLAAFLLQAVGITLFPAVFLPASPWWQIVSVLVLFGALAFLFRKIRRRSVLRKSGQA